MPRVGVRSEVYRKGADGLRKLVNLDKPSLGQKRFNAQGLADLLEKTYLDQRREPGDYARRGFTPSSLGYKAGRCPRRWFYDFSGGVVREEDMDVISVANMAYGTQAHERLQELFEQSGILVEAERKIAIEYPPINGFVDLIVNWEGDEAVGEIKTTMQESFVSKQAKNKPAGYHLLQLLIYMKALGITKGFLLYENKNMQNLLIIPVNWNAVNEQIANETWEWMETVYDAFKEGQLPKRPFKKSGTVCANCPFQKHCWDDETGVVDLPLLSVPD